MCANAGKHYIRKLTSTRIILRSRGIISTQYIVKDVSIRALLISTHRLPSLFERFHNNNKCLPFKNLREYKS